MTAYASELGAVIEASGDCHPVIEWNPSIVATIPSWHRSGAALSCLERDGISSRCVVANNSKVENEWVSLPYHLMNGINGTGVLCTGTSCARIDENNIVGARGPTGGSGSGLNVYGVGISLSGGSALIRGNDVTGACSNACNSAGVGVSAVAANGILEGNEVLGACGRTGGAMRALFRRRSRHCEHPSGRMGDPLEHDSRDTWLTVWRAGLQSTVHAIPAESTRGRFVERNCGRLHRQHHVSWRVQRWNGICESVPRQRIPGIFQDNHLTADPRLVNVGPLRGSLRLRRRLSSHCRGGQRPHRHAGVGHERRCPAP